MNRIANAAVAALVSLSTFAVSIDTASAGHRHRHAWVAGGAGLATGLILGGIIASQPRVVVEPRVRYRRVDAHVAWCSDRYRSYDYRSNTWVDLRGRIRNCASPYGY